MKTQSEGKHRGAQTAVVVDPVRRILVVVQPGYVSTNPDSGVSEVIEAAGRRIWIMLINGRSPVDRYAAKNQAEKERNGKPVTNPYLKVVPADYEGAGLGSPRARSRRFTRSA